MQIVMAGLVGLMVSVGAGAEPVVEGWVRLASGEPVAGAQVLVLDLKQFAPLLWGRRQRRTGVLCCR